MRRDRESRRRNGDPGWGRRLAAGGALLTALGLVVGTAVGSGGTVGGAGTALGEVGAPVGSAGAPVGSAARAADAEAETTRLLVRAVARDAKVIGSNVGGARITVRDAQTGEVLAEGVQEGSTGSTEAIMRDPKPRGRSAYGADPEAAGFVAELSLERPTRVEVTAEGPLGTAHAMQRASKTLLLIPGVHVEGEGLILELNGFTVKILDASRHQDGTLAVRAHVEMLCGCPTEPGGMWDADDYRILARLVRDGEVVWERPMRYAGRRSEYESRLPMPNGEATLQVLAADPSTANFGMAEQPL